MSVVCGCLLLLTAWVAGAAEPPLRFPPDREVDVTRIALDLDVDLEGRRVVGTATLDARALAVPLEHVSLDAHQLEVSSVADGAGRELAFRAVDDRLEISLAEPVLERGTPLRLVVAYAARPELGLNWFGPTETDPDVPLQVWSQNEAVDARRWFPCIDHPQERQATEVRVTVPPGMQVISNGRQVSEPEPVAAGRVRWHYRQDEEHTAYLVTLVVGRFHTVRDTWNGLPLAYHVPPDRADDVGRSFGRTKEMLDFFTERLGVAYPWPKYEQVVVEQFSFGGMENTGATTLNERTLHSARAHLDTSSEGLVAHELAHQWFGDLVTCRDWAHIWLNEGFASFLEATWDEHANGPDAYDWNLLNKARGALAGGRNTPIVRRRYHKPSDCFGGPTYPKGAWVLHMLRRELGERDFWGGLRAYLTAWGGRAPETEDLRRVLEERTGRGLGRFFQQWLERSGHPTLGVEVRWRAKQKILEVSLRQEQGGEAFHFRYDVATLHADGSRRLVPLQVTGKTARLLLPLDEAPVAVGLDPELRVLAETRLRGDRDLLVGTLARAPKSVSRVRAARALAADGHPAALAALSGAARSDESVGVCIESIRGLGSKPGPEARDALLGILVALDEPGGLPPRERAWARHAVVEQLEGRAAEPGVREALRYRASGEELSERVQGRAARALARVALPEDADRFGRLLTQASTNEELRRAAVAGLAALPGAAGLPQLRSLAAPLGSPPTVRTDALRALGRVAARRSVAAPARTEVVDLLSAALQERSPRFRRAALAGLRELGAEAGEALPAIEALAAHDPHQGVSREAKRAAQAIRKGAPADAELARLREELRRALEEGEAMRERLERVEDRLEGASLDGKAGVEVPQ
jgi:aminopeptidase N